MVESLTFEWVTAYVDASEIDTNGDYRIYVNYNYNGTKHDHILLSGINVVKAVGEEIEIRVNPDFPEDIRYFSKTTIYIVLILLLGLLLVGGGSILLIENIVKENSYKEIIKNGVRVLATVTKVTPYQNVYNSKNQYYVVECEYVEKTFSSRPFKNMTDISEGDLVPVYYTSIRKGKIFVDIANVEFKNNKNDNWSFK